MNQTAKVVVKGSNYAVVRFFRWVAIASFAIFFIALWLAKLVLAAVGFVVLIIARLAGSYYHGKGRAVRAVFDAGSVVSPWTYGRHLILLPQMTGCSLSLLR